MASFFAIIYPFWETLIAFVEVEKVIVFTKDLDFAHIFFLIPQHSFWSTLTSTIILSTW